MTTPPQLLIVDDDLEFLEILVGRFSRRGFAVSAHTTCADALEAAGKQSFDVAIVDRTVPGGKDLELLVRLSSIDAGLPIVVLSGWSGPQYAEEALAAGAREYLAKPCALADIEDAVRRALSLRAADPLCLSARTEKGRPISRPLSTGETMRRPPAFPFR